MFREVFYLALCSVACVFCEQFKSPATIKVSNSVNDLSNSIGNFSLEILYETAKLQGNQENLIVSPITVWTTLAVIAEGAGGRTFLQIANITRLPKNVNRMRNSLQNIFKYLLVNTSTVELDQMNSLFVDNSVTIERDYKEDISTFYKTQLIPVNFTDTKKTAAAINQYAQHITRNRITNLVDEASIADSVMLLASGIYFKGQWSVPFNVTSTEKRPFYDSNGKNIGEVNMMYNRHVYPFANIKELQARVIELPYGVEGRLSMLIMLPHHNVTLYDMFLNFRDTNLTFNKVFQELRLIQEEFGDDEVDCFIPRFKIESSLVLDRVLKELYVSDMFDQRLAQ